jgi:hypothetical protein
MERHYGEDRWVPWAKTLLSFLLQDRILLS